VHAPATAPELIAELAGLVRGAQTGNLPACVVPEGFMTKCARRGARRV
jgi:hypothetical protein